MKKAVLLSSLYEPDGTASGPFEMFYRNLAAGLNKISGETGWTAQVIGKAGVKPPIPGCGGVFEPPPSMRAGKKLLAALDGFRKKLNRENFICNYSGKLRENADVLASADVIHAHDAPALLALESSGLAGAAPLCFTPGALSGFGREPDAPERLVKDERAALAAGFILAPSRDYINALERAYGPFKQPYVILPGLEDEKYLRTGALRRKLGVPESALLAAAFCGGDPQAETGFFIEAFAAAKKQVGGKLFAAVIVEENAGLKDKAAARGLERSFFFLSAQAARGEILAEADIFFSALSAEGGPPPIQLGGHSAGLFDGKYPVSDMGVIEALRAGLAVAAADNGWNAEAAGYGEAAALFKAGDAVSAGTALADIALHPAALVYFSAKARDYFKAQYTLEAFAARAAKAYEDVLARQA